MKKVISFVVLACLLFLTLGVTPVYADEVPALPHAFYGSVSINDSPAPAGTIVEARGEGVATGIAGNPTITSVSGIYGTSNPLEPRLIVQGNIEEGATITFYVNDVSTSQTAEWYSGETTGLNLSVTISEPPPSPPARGGAPRAPVIEAILFGSAQSFSISASGEVLETIAATSPDGKLTITIPAGTIAVKDGKPLSSLTVDVDPSPPDPPEGDNIIGLVYDFGPEGATFTPPITVTFTYDPEEVAEGEELVVMVWDEDAEEWVEVDAEDYTINTEDNTISLLVSGFSKYAIIARAAPAPPPRPAVFSLSNLTVQPAEVELGGMVTIAVEVANTGGTIGSYTVVLQLNGVKEAEKSASIAAGSSEIVTFSVTKDVAGSYSVTVDGLDASFTVVAPPPPTEEVEEEIVLPPEEEGVEEEIVPSPEGIAWWVWLIIGVVAVVVVALVGFVWVRRRAY